MECFAACASSEDNSIAKVISNISLSTITDSNREIDTITGYECKKNDSTKCDVIGISLTGA